MAKCVYSLIAIVAVFEVPQIAHRSDQNWPAHALWRPRWKPFSTRPRQFGTSRGLNPSYEWWLPSATYLDMMHTTLLQNESIYGCPYPTHENIDISIINRSFVTNRASNSSYKWWLSSATCSDAMHTTDPEYDAIYGHFELVHKGVQIFIHS
jgi:hypothetical protein